MFYEKANKYYLTELGKQTLRERLLNKDTLSLISKDWKISMEALGRMARELMGDTFSFRRKSYLRENYFEIIDTQEKAYWLGFLTADGYITSENEINIQLQKQDKQHLQKFSQAIDGNLTVRDINGKNNFGVSYSHYRVSFRSSKMTQDLAKWGIVPNKSLTVFFPKLSIELINYWILGLLDGDGCIAKNKKKLRVSFTSTYDILFNIKDFLGSQSVISKEHRCENTYSIQLENQLSYDFLTRMNYAELPFCLERKKKTFIELSSVIE